ncbi:MAG: PEP/pyruvate-binding domain-containing protein [bacterium]
MSYYGLEPTRLMSWRINDVLFVSSPYDLYIIEEEGLLADRISDEYTILHLTSAPSISHASTAEEAIAAVEEHDFDLVITSQRVGKGRSVFDMAAKIKELKPDLPVVLLTPEMGSGGRTKKRRESPAIDKVFNWHGDTRIFLAIIKCLEDRVNAEHDCLKEDVRAIILVEDSPHFYSDYLPLIYTEIMEQTRSLVFEGATADEKLRMMRRRPKILMAGSYEEAVELFEKYRDNLLGIISDVRFPRGGALDAEAGFAFTELVKGENPDTPVLLQSKDAGNAGRAGQVGASYVDKNSPHLLTELGNFIKNYFGFGDFLFRMPDGTEIARATTMQEMENLLGSVPDESVAYHSRRNHFSNWFYARGEFALAAKIKPINLSDFSSVAGLRKELLACIHEAAITKRWLNIARFSERNLDLSMFFMRFGTGSIGGKGRGIGFLSKLVQDPEIAKRFRGQAVEVPQTVAIGTDVFDNFLETNRLHRVAIDAADDGAIAKAFLAAEIEPRIVGDIASFLRRTEGPLAVRSSSLSEDSLSQPFAGLYSTYLLPNNHPDFDHRLAQFLAAVKLVYASTFFADPRAYMEANGIAVESEKMAVIVQRIVGRRHGDFFYPDVAGVAQSYNFFPVGYLKPEDGIAQIVLGLGTMAVRGERVLRFCPRYPTILPQFSKPADILAQSQRSFHVIDLINTNPALFTDENVTLATLDIMKAEEHGVLPPLGGTYSREDDVIYDGVNRTGPKVLTFKDLLSGQLFPLPSLLAEMLDIGAEGMGCPVEMEFAANLASDGAGPSLSVLQIRPLVSGEEAEEVSVEGIAREDCIALSNKAMGNGNFTGIRDVVFVKPEAFDQSRTAEIAEHIGKVNAHMVARGDNYVLMGFGRWGTTNSALGIPVTYAQISHAKVIAEISTEQVDVEPSQGTHFFHNITSSRIGYLSIDEGTQEGFVDWGWLHEQHASLETAFIKHIRLKDPIAVRIDGHSGRGVILKS